MTSKPPDPFLGTVKRKVERMEQARRQPRGFWQNLVHVGVLGWLFVIPVVFFTFVGRFAARVVGQPALAVALIVVGVGVGGYAVWHQLRPSVRDQDEEER
ncbi:MAG: AtpZ/AtpI family protein [Polyangiaceae bacterium]